MSDVDLTLIPNVKSHLEIPKIARLTRSLRKFFLFLGEFEIYTPQDFQRKTELELQISFIFETIRNTRKLRWLINEIPNCPSDFHKYKNTRAIRNTCRKLRLKTHKPENALSEAYRQLADKLYPENMYQLGQKIARQQSYIHHYLGTTLALSSLNDGVMVSHEVCAKLLIALPIQFTGNHELDRLLLSYREEFKLKSLVRTLAEIELITFRSYLITQTKPSNSDLEWEQEVLAVYRSCLTETLPQ